MLQSNELRSRFFAKISKGKKQRDCWRWTGSKSNGYGITMVNGQRCTAHRVSYAMHSGMASLAEMPSGMHVCHTCDTPACVNPAHLIIGTPQSNHEQMIRRGRLNSGGAAPLSPQQVKEIRALITQDDFEDIRKIAAAMTKFGLHEAPLRHVVLRKTYDWIK